MNKMNKTFLFLTLIGMTAIMPSWGFARGEKQIPAHSNELPWLQYFGIGARAMGMGGTAISIVDDGTALYWNPAGLARIRATELTATLSHEKAKATTEFFANEAEKEIAKTRA